MTTRTPPATAGSPDGTAEDPWELLKRYLEPDTRPRKRDAKRLRARITAVKSPVAPWLTALVRAGDETSLRRVYAERAPFHEVMADWQARTEASTTARQNTSTTARPGTPTTARQNTSTTNTSTTARLREVSGLSDVFGADEPLGLHAVRVMAGLALELVTADPEESRLRTALVWYEAAGSSPVSARVAWTPEALADGNERLLAVLKRLVDVAGEEAAGGAAYTTAVVLYRLATGSMPGRGREPVSVRVLFDLGGRGAVGQLQATYLPGGPTALVPHPETIPLFSGDAAFRGALDVAWTLAGADRLWGTVLWTVQDIGVVEQDPTPQHMPQHMQQQPPQSPNTPRTPPTPRTPRALRALRAPRTPRALRALRAPRDGGPDVAKAAVADPRTASGTSALATLHETLSYVEGPSLGAAFAVVLREIRRIRPPALTPRTTPRWAGTWLWQAVAPTRLTLLNAVTGAVDEQGVLRPVGGYRVKLEAARRTARLVVPSYDGEEARQAAERLPEGVRPQIVPVLHWRQAARKARRRSTQAILKAVTVPALIAALVAGGLWYQARGAAEAERTQKQARALLNDAVAARDSDPALSLRLALAAERLDPSEANRTALLETLLVSRYRGELPTRADQTTRTGSGEARTGSGEAPTGPGKAPTGSGEAPALHALGYTNGGRTLLTRDAERITAWDVAGRRTVSSFVPGPRPDSELFYRTTRAVLEPDPTSATVVVGTLTKGAELWTFDNPARPRRLAALPLPGVLDARFSGDGETLVTISSAPALELDPTADEPDVVTLWDTSDPARPKKLAPLPPREEGADEVWGVALDATGSRLAVAEQIQVDVYELGPHGEAERLTRIDPNASQAKDHLRPSGGGQINPTEDVAFSARDNNIVYTATSRPLAAGAGLADNFVNAWDLTEGKGSPYELAAVYEGSIQVVPGPAGGVATYAADGSVIVSKEVRIHPDGTEQKKTRPRTPDQDQNPGPATRFAYSPDGKTLATYGTGRTVRFWDVADRRWTPDAAPLIDAEHAAYSARTGVLAVVGHRSRAVGAPREVALYDTARGLPYGLLGVLPQRAETVASLAFSADGTMLVVGGSDESRQGGGGTPPPSDEPAGQVFGNPGDALYEDGAAEQADGTRDDGAQDGVIIRWDVRTPSSPRALPGTLRTTGPTVTSVAVSDDKRVIAATNGSGQAVVWSVAGDRVSGPVVPAVSGALPSEDGGGDAMTEAGSQLSLGARGKLLAIHNGRGEVSLWNLDDPSRPRRLSAVSAAGDGSPRLSADGTSLWVREQRWDLSDPRRPEPLPALPVPTGRTGLRLTEAGPWGALLTTEDRDSSLWFVRPGMAPVSLGTNQFYKPVRAFAMAPGQVLLGNFESARVIDASATVRLAQDPRRAACDLVGTGLTRAEWKTYVPSSPYRKSCD
ncbi:WD40 repeat domain-containing protein [Streptomyces sp. NPDC002018]|uniref:WD40 repeat domain-containing protein n=1 Tax=Streptomyces sp. NPDC002018 TaxID=3364629 RepID=UPI0036A6F6C6